MVLSPVASPSRSPLGSRSASPAITSVSVETQYRDYITPLAPISPLSPSWSCEGNAVSDEDYRSETSVETSGSCNMHSCTKKALSVKESSFSNYVDLSARLRFGIENAKGTELFGEDTIGADVVLCADCDHEKRNDKHSQSSFDTTTEGTSVKYHVHRFILAASSAPFRAMLTGGMRETSQREIFLHGIGPHVLKKMLYFIYTGEVEIDVDDAVDTLIAAEIYELGGLRVICKDFVLLHAHEIFRGKHFMQLPEKLLVELVERDELQIREIALLEALVNWGCHSAASSDKKIIDVLAEVMDHVRFPTMSVSDLYGKVRPLVNDGYIRESLLTEALFYQLKWGPQSGKSSKRMKQRILTASLRKRKRVSFTQHVSFVAD